MMDCAFDNVAFDSVAFDACPKVQGNYIGTNYQNLDYITRRREPEAIRPDRHKREEEEIVIL